MFQIYFRTHMYFKHFIILLFDIILYYINLLFYFCSLYLFSRIFFIIYVIVSIHMRILLRKNLVESTESLFLDMSKQIFQLTKQFFGSRNKSSVPTEFLLLHRTKSCLVNQQFVCSYANRDSVDSIEFFSQCTILLICSFREPALGNK